MVARRGEAGRLGSSKDWEGGEKLTVEDGTTNARGGKRIPLALKHLRLLRALELARATAAALVLGVIWILGGNLPGVYMQGSTVCLMV